MNERYDDEQEWNNGCPPEADADQEERERVAAFSGWGISLALHALVAMILLFVVVASKLIPVYPASQVSEITPPPPPPEIDRPVNTIDDPRTEVVADVQDDEPLIEQLDVQVEKLETEEPEIDELQRPKGRLEAKARSETGETGAFMAIGPGGDNSGAYGHRRGGGRQLAVGTWGGSRGSENAVEAALRWFQRHQSPNGQWDVDGYPVNCERDGPRCEPGANRSGADEAVTGYALMCYLGAGYDHRIENPYRETIKKALGWLVQVQGEDGGWGRNYENGVCAMALAQAYAMTMDPTLREPAQKALDLLRERQGPGEGKDAYGGSGWNYVNHGGERNDSSVTGWCVMAMKSGKAAGLDTKGGLEGAKWWLEKAWKATNPNWEQLDPYTDKSQFPYTFNELNNDIRRDNLSCVGALCAVFLDHHAGDPMLETLTNDILDRHLDKSRSWPTDSYYLYYNTLAVFQNGGEKWQRWNQVVRDMLVDSQRRENDCFDGSWDPQGAGGHGIAKVGRTLVTAYACLSLEVYYIYLPVGLER